MKVVFLLRVSQAPLSHVPWSKSYHLSSHQSCSSLLSPCRADKTLQDIVYKLVPGLFKSKYKKYGFISVDFLQTWAGLNKPSLLSCRWNETSQRFLCRSSYCSWWVSHLTLHGTGPLYAPSPPCGCTFHSYAFFFGKQWRYLFWKQSWPPLSWTGQVLFIPPPPHSSSLWLIPFLFLLLFIYLFFVIFVLETQKGQILIDCIGWDCCSLIMWPTLYRIFFRFTSSSARTFYI